MDQILYKTYKEEAYMIVKSELDKYVANEKQSVNGGNKRSIKRVFETKAFLETADQELDLSLT